jgi:RNA polymerase sigma-70 factor, ECF subfamily
VARCRAGDIHAYDILMKASYPALFLALSRVLDRREDVEDVLQEAFFIGYRKIGSFREEGSFAAWIYGIAANLIKRRAAQCHKQCAYLEELGIILEQASGKGDPAEQMVLREAIRDALLGLPEKQRSVLMMYLYDNKTYQEIASALGCSLGTIGTRLHRGIKRLRQELGDLRRGGR